MNKYLPFLAVLLSASLLLAGCTGSVGSSVSAGLQFDDSLFATQDASGTLNPVSENAFKRGDSVNLVLTNVRGFKAGKDGKHSFDMDLEFVASNGSVLLSQKEMLGARGNVLLEDGKTNSLTGTVRTTTNLQPGTYTVKLRVYDKVGGGSLTASKSFELK